MAKINTGTITANSAGNWTSDAITFANGAQRVYMRVDGAQVLYRDFTITPSFGFESGFPVTATGDFDGGPYSTKAVQFTTTGASLIVILVSNQTSTTSAAVTGVSGSSLGAFTQAHYNDYVNNAGASVWYKASAGAISSTETVTATFQNSQYRCAVTALSIIGANASPIGTNKGGAQDNASAASCSLTATAVGSMIIGCGASISGVSPTWDANTSVINLFTDPSWPERNFYSFKRTNLTSDTVSYTVGTSAPNPAIYSICAVEILAA